jgi:hypothetical protein
VDVNRVGAGHEAQRRLVLACEPDERAFMLFQAVTVCLVRSA